MRTKLALIDDSELALEWAKENLTRRNFDVVTYNQSLGIQVFVRRHQPDIVLLDVNMPALNGDIVCKMLKQHKETRLTKVALYSGLNEDELQALVTACGADGYIRKTDDVDDFVRQIERVLSK